MNRGFMYGQRQPHRRLAPRKGGFFGGLPIGILLIEDTFPMLPGNVANAGSFGFPVLYHVLEGVPFERIAAGDPSVLDAVIAGGEALIANGVRAVVGACGSFANYQQGAAAALKVPVFLSSMLQVPWILASLQAHQKLLVIAAAASALTPKVFEQCGISDRNCLLIEQAAELPEFEAMTSPKGFNPAKLEAELVSHVTGIVRDHSEAGAILLQCSDLPPFAWAMQNATGLPVYDMNTLISWVHSAVVRRPYNGII